MLQRSSIRHLQIQITKGTIREVVLPKVLSEANTDRAIFTKTLRQPRARSFKPHLSLVVPIRLISLR